MTDTKGCGQLMSNNTYFSDIWCSGVKISEEVMSEGVDYCGPAKIIHKSFCIATLEKLTKYWLGGLYIVLKNTPRVPGDIPLMLIRYNYNSRKVL